MINCIKSAKHAALGFAVAATTMITAPAAQASSVTLQYEGSNAWGSPVWARSISYVWNGTSRSHGAGMFRMEDTATSQSVLAFCIDLAQALASSAVYDISVPFVSADRLQNIDRLYTSSYASVNDADSAAGFQLALWEIMSDTGSTGGLDLGSGSFQTTGTSAAYTTAASYLANIGTATGGYDLTTFFNGSSQDVVSGTAIQTPASVPLPASALLLLSGVAGAGFVGRRRRKA
jgi:hypothetical protein